LIDSQHFALTRSGVASYGTLAHVPSSSTSNNSIFNSIWS